MFRSTLFLAFSLVFGSLLAQVPRTLVVEHFTNTRCGICASRNPGFYTNLGNHPEVLHLSVHPSAPYSTCIHNVHNPSENDARTNYYDIYGGTPRLVIQGTVISAGANYASETIFDPFEGTTSPASLRLEQSKTEDSIRVRVIVKTEALHNLDNLRLFVAAVEDTIFYQAPNGESAQYHVFRRAFTAAEGNPWVLAPNVGDSIVFTAALAMHPDWNAERMYTMAILQQESNQSVLQAAATNPADDNLTTAIEPVHGAIRFEYFPNPARESLNVRLLQNQPANLELFRLTGQSILSERLDSETRLDLSQLPAGIYLLRLSNENGQVIRRIVKR